MWRARLLLQSARHLLPRAAVAAAPVALVAATAPLAWEGSRVSCDAPQNFVTSRGVKQSLAPGEFVFKSGDSVDYFYLLTSGEAEAMDGSTVLGSVSAGEYIGEISLLENRKEWDVAVRCKTACEIVKVTKADFEGALKESGCTSTALDSRVFAFVTTCASSAVKADLKKDTPVFKQGESIDPSFYVLQEGQLAVTQKVKGKGEVFMGQIEKGGCFGEMTLLQADQPKIKNFTVTCTSPKCTVVTVSGDDFHRVLDKSRAFRRSMQDLIKKRKNANITANSQTRVFGRQAGALSMKGF